MQEFRSYSFAANYVSIKVPNSVTVITTSKINWQERGDERAIKVIKAFSLKNNLKLHQQRLMFIREASLITHIYSIFNPNKVPNTNSEYCPIHSRDTIP